MTIEDPKVSTEDYVLACLRICDLVAGDTLTQSQADAIQLFVPDSVKELKRKQQAIEFMYGKDGKPIRVADDTGVKIKIEETK